MTKSCHGIQETRATDIERNTILDKVIVVLNFIRDSVDQSSCVHATGIDTIIIRWYNDYFIFAYYKVQLYSDFLKSIDKYLPIT